MMVLLLLNLTGCPSGQKNKDVVGNTTSQDAQDEIIILTEEETDNLFKNLGNNPVASAEFEYTIGEDTSNFTCDFVDSTQPSTIQSKRTGSTS